LLCVERKNTDETKVCSITSAIEQKDKDFGELKAAIEFLRIKSILQL
jgi:hypothetical protein